MQRRWKINYEHIMRLCILTDRKHSQAHTRNVFMSCSRNMQVQCLSTNVVMYISLANSAMIMVLVNDFGSFALRNFSAG